MPPRLLGAVRLRVGLLPSDTRDVLHAAAVLGQSFATATLAHVLGMDADEARRRLEPAIASGLVVPDDACRLRFAYPLLRQAVDALGRG